MSGTTRYHSHRRGSVPRCSVGSQPIRSRNLDSSPRPATDRIRTTLLHIAPSPTPYISTCARPICVGGAGVSNCSGRVRLRQWLRLGLTRLTAAPATSAPRRPSLPERPTGGREVHVDCEANFAESALLNPDHTVSATSLGYARLGTSTVQLTWTRLNGGWSPRPFGAHVRVADHPPETTVTPFPLTGLSFSSVALRNSFCSA